MPNMLSSWNKDIIIIIIIIIIRGMNLKLCINVHDISLYINCVFIAFAYVFSLLWQLKVSIDL